MFSVMTKDKYPRHRQHHRVKRELPEPNYALRRLVVGTVLAGTAVAGFNAVRADDEGSFLVDRTEVESLDPTTRTAQYDSFRIDPDAEPEELGVAPDLYGVAEEYKETYGLHTDVRNIVHDLEVQNGGTSEVQPGAVLYLPHRESPDQP